MAERDFYVLVYDVVDDKRRLKVARLLEAVGERVQYSVFEAYLSSQELERVLGRVRNVIGIEDDGLRVYRLCALCRQNVVTLGRGDVTSPPGLMIV